MRNVTALQGRAWLWRNHNYQARITLEWMFLWKARSCHIGIECNGVDDKGMLVFLAIPFLFSVYLGLDFKWLNRLMPTYRSTYLREPVDLPARREIRFAIHHWGFWWHLWTDTLQWSSDLPRWRWGSFYPLDFLFGRGECREDELEKGRSRLSMPEGDYVVIYRVYRAVWHRPRWPWWPMSTCVDRIEVTFDPPVPTPGKGTASYNCGDDAWCKSNRILHEYGVRETLRDIRSDILKERMDRAGARWVPHDGWPVSVADESGAGDGEDPAQ